jgi:hypothetical protein
MRFVPTNTGEEHQVIQYFDREPHPIAAIIQKQPIEVKVDVWSLPK